MAGFLGLGRRAVPDGHAEFDVMREWNRSEVYRRTLVYFAEQLQR